MGLTVPHAASTLVCVVPEFTKIFSKTDLENVYTSESNLLKSIGNP